MRAIFTSKAQDYSPRVPDSKECGAGIYEKNEVFRDDSDKRYMGIMVNTCTDFIKKYTVYMDIQDWFNMEQFYTTWDAETGAVVKDSVISECHRYVHDDQILGCTFEVGHLPHYREYGLTDPDQMRAAWVNGPDDLGLLWYEEEWVSI